MRAVIMQPSYMPWLGYFDRIEKSDVFIVFDNAQFTHKTSILFQNRNKIRIAKVDGKDGWQWITVPVKSNNGEPIREVKIDNSQKWAEKHWKAIMFNYANAKYFDNYSNFLERMYNVQWELLYDLNMETMKFLLDELGIKTDLVISSQIEKVKAKASDHLIGLCKEVGADEYLSGPYGKEYLEMDKFEKAGIKVEIHEFAHPEYEQAFPGFEANLSALDILLNHGKEGSRKIMGWK